MHPSSAECAALVVQMQAAADAHRLQALRNLEDPRKRAQYEAKAEDRIMQANRNLSPLQRAEVLGGFRRSTTGVQLSHKQMDDALKARGDDPNASQTALGAAQAETQAPATPQPQITLPASVPLTIPHSSNPFHAYLPTEVPPANLANSARLDTLVHNGVLEISLQDAIALALENNLDLAIARYNIPIAEADILRTKAGGITRGVNAGVVQNTPGGGGVGEVEGVG